MRNKFVNKKGAVLPLVVILLSVVLILTTATVTAVSFESKHSIIDESQTKAYYLARSAVSAVAEAIERELYDLNSLETSLLSAADTYNTTNDPMDLIIHNDLLNDFNSKRTYILNNILPLSSTFNHSVDGIDLSGMDATISDVSVTRIPDGYRLEASSTVKNYSAKAILKMNITMSTRDYEIRTTETNEEILTETTTTTIPKGDPAGFGDALYSYGDLYLDNNIYLYKYSKSNDGKGRYEGEEQGKQKIQKGLIEKAGESTPVDPVSLLPINVNEDYRYQSIIDTLPNFITSDNNGYYGSVVIENNDPKTFTIDTTKGDVVLKFNRLELDNNVVFNVIGKNYFYIYIYDNNVSDGGLYMTYKNNLEVNSHDGVPRTFIIIDQPPSDQNTTNNSIDFYMKNNTSFYGYIYAPYSRLEIKNNGDFYGSIVAGNIKVKNNLEIIHIPPETGTSTEDEDGNQIITVVTEKIETTTKEVVYPQTLEIIPIAIDKEWLSR